VAKGELPVCGRIALFLLFALALLPGQASAARQQALRLGFVGYLLSGPNYDFGAVAGAELAVAQINRAGGLIAPDGTTYTLELAIESATDEVSARAAIQSLLERGVIALLGPDAVDQTRSNLDLAAEARVPQLTSTLAAALTAQDVSDFVFRIRASDLARSQALADYLVNQMGFRRVGTSFTNTPYGNAGIVTFDAVLGDFGLQPVIEAQHDAADLDMTVAAQVIASNAPEVVVHWGNPYQAAMLLQELRALGWQGVFVYSDIAPTFLGLLSGDQTAGVMGPLTWVYTLPEPASRAFLADYVQAFGVIPSERSAAYYDAVQLVAAAVRAVGREPAAIRDYLLNLPTFLAVQGNLEPGAFGDGETGANVVIVEIDRDTFVPRARARYRGGACVAGCEGTPPLLAAAVPTVAASPTQPPAPAIPTTPTSPLCAATSSPTPSPTSVSTATPTPTATLTLTPSFTPTLTWTPRPTWTPSATLPVIVTLTPTFTPTSTPTASRAPAGLEAPALTYTAIPTPVPSPTATATATVTGTPSSTSTAGPVFVQTGDVRMNLRAGPGVDYRAVGVLPEETRVRVVGRSADNYWLVVEHEGGEAWLAGWLVTVVEGDLELLPIRAPWGVTATPGQTPVGMPILAVLYALDSDEAMDMVRVLLRLEEEYGRRVRFAYIDVNRISDYPLYRRIFGGTVPAIGLIDRENVLRQVFTGTVAEADLRARLDILLTQ
jgi:ABC-type branched-subunit amino acid transport system substrate-binding protein